MNDPEICYTCEGSTIYRIMGMCQGWFCEKCREYSIVTTFMPEILSDPTQYTITLISADANDIEHIKTLAKITNKNFIQTKKFLNTKDEIGIFNGGARETKATVRELELVLIRYKIHPDFKY